MEGFTLFKQGAEARLLRGTYLGKPVLAKERFVKKYRHPDLDAQLTKERTRAESRAIVKCKSFGIDTPTIYLVDLHRRTIFMEYFEHSITVKEFINNNLENSEVLKNLTGKIAEVLAKMHGNNIVHGDLTTSNFLLVNNNGEGVFDSFDQLKLVAIDFGLSLTNVTPEDCAVDLYVLERALISTHSIAEQLFPDIIAKYKHEFKGSAAILSKLQQVQARGRKRTMIG